MIRAYFLGFAVALVTIFPIANAHSASETVLYSFCSQANCADGAQPAGRLVFDSSGNLIGTTEVGGTAGGCQFGVGCGTMFKLAADGTESILHTFTGTDGALPLGGVIVDDAGNFFGTTEEGGDNGPEGDGTVFEVSADGTETVLHSFDKMGGGLNPFGELIEDKKGDLFGSTLSGGHHSKHYPCGSEGCGVAFKVQRASSNYSVRYKFKGDAGGLSPNGAPARDKNGNLYLTTRSGGNTSCAGFSPYGCGAIVKVASDRTATVLYAFAGGSDGAVPEAGLTADDTDNFYGTTIAGGDAAACGNGCGTLFELTASGVETVFYAFRGGSDGYGPLGLVRDKAGDLYGVTAFGGNKGCNGLGCGIVFKISPSGIETILYSFTGGEDGGFPRAGLLMGPHGKLYGTTNSGGKYNQGVVFEIKQ